MAILATAIATPAQAQVQPQAQNSLLPQVDIVGVAPSPGVDIDRDLLPYIVQGASASNMREAQAGTLGEFMARHLAGVNVNDISGSPFQTDITYRGFRASPVLGTGQGLSVWLDGVRVNEPFGDVVNWDMLPEAAIANVVLVPGANPLYGLNSLGGALAISTGSGRSHPGTRLTVDVGSNGQRRLDASQGVVLPDGYHALAAGTLFEDLGWREHSDGHLANLFFKFGRRTAKTDWSLSLLGARSELKGNGLLPDSLYGANRRAAYTFPDQTGNRLGLLTFHLKRPLGEDQALSLAVYVRSSSRRTVSGDVADDVTADVTDDAKDGAEASFNTTRMQQHSRGATLQWTTNTARHHASAGASIDRDRVDFAQFEQQGYFSAAREVLRADDAATVPAGAVAGADRHAALFASDTWTIVPGTSVTAALRLNHARVNNVLTSERGPQPSEQFSYRHWNPSLGVSQRAGAATLFANIAQNNRVPTAIELGCADPVQSCRLPVGLQSDPYLSQVISTSLEAGMRWTTPSSQASIAAFRTINRDDILFLHAATPQQGYFANFPRTLHQGLDFSARHRRGALEGHVSYSYLDAHYDAGATLFTGVRDVAIRPGMRIAGLPRHTLKLGLQWRVNGKLALGADGRLQSSQVSQGNEDGAIAGANVGGHGLLHLRASYQLTRQWQLFARVSNVFDRRYETFGALAVDHFSAGRFDADGGPARFIAPGAPRAFAAGARAAF